MTILRITLFSIVLSLFTSCGNALEEKKNNTLASYKIISNSKEEYPNSDRHILTIGIDSTLSIDQLSAISDSIIQQNKQHVTFFNIVYQLADTTSGYLIYSETYAETKLDSLHYQTQILYNKKNTVSPQNEDLQPEHDYDIIGSWKNEFGSYYMYKKDGVYYLDNSYIDGSGGTQKLSTRKRNGQLSYNVEGDNTEYFIIKEDGLYIYDRWGDLGTIYKNAY